MARERKPPQNAQELLERYAAGEREFARASLCEANLRGVHLQDVNLTGAALRQADLTGATILASKLVGADLTDAKLPNTTFVGVDLTEATLRGVWLHRSEMSDTCLRSSVFDHAEVSDATIRGSNLSEAYLLKSNFRQVLIEDTNMTSTDARQILLSGTQLRSVDLSRSRCDGALVLGASFVDVDLTALCQASPQVEHRAPSHVEYRSVVRSLFAPNLKVFLQRTGMPEVFVEYMVSCALSVQTDAFKLLRSTYLIFGKPDEPFARKLYEALHRNGVTTFFFPEHSVPGKRLHRAMHEGIAGHDRTVLICSKNSLDREGVLFELDQTLAREAREKKGEYLLPVLLDDYVFEGWNPPDPQHLAEVRGRVCADFRGADQDDDKFNAGLLKLIAALRK